MSYVLEDEFGNYLGEFTTISGIKEMHEIARKEKMKAFKRFLDKGIAYHEELPAVIAEIEARSERDLDYIADMMRNSGDDSGVKIWDGVEVEPFLDDDEME